MPATQNEIFRPLSLFQSNCIHRSNEKEKQAICFNFPEISLLLADHESRVPGAEGQGPNNRTLALLCLTALVTSQAAQRTVKPHEIGYVYV